jgi:D-alanyl-D-alanine dipeptidase
MRVLKPLLVLFLAITIKADIPSSFDYLYNIDPSIILQPRYAISQNFVGAVVDGYLRQTVIMAKNAGYALANVQADMRRLGYSLVVYDAYRPQKAVDHFMRWS